MLVGVVCVFFFFKRLINGFSPVCLFYFVAAWCLFGWLINVGGSLVGFVTLERWCLFGGFCICFQTFFWMISGWFLNLF